MLVAAAVAVSTARPAFAHTEVRRASPSPGEVVVGAVESVELEFLDPVLPTVAISVRTVDGDTVDGVGEVAHSDDGLEASVSFAPLSVAGDYVVDYEFVAVDGDAQIDAYRFTVDAPVTTLGEQPEGGGIIPRPDSGVEPEDAGDRGGALQTLVFVVVVGGVVLIGGLVVRESRRARSERGF